MLTLTNLTSEAEAVLGARSDAVVKILDDDCYVGFTADLYTVVENVIGGKALISVARFGSIHRVMSVDYATTIGTATEGTDYVAANGTLTFAKGETNKTFAVTIDLKLAQADEVDFALQRAPPAHGIQRHQAPARARPARGDIGRNPAALGADDERRQVGVEVARGTVQ